MYKCEKSKEKTKGYELIKFVIIGYIISILLLTTLFIGCLILILPALILYKLVNEDIKKYSDKINNKYTRNW